MKVDKTKKVNNSVQNLLIIENSLLQTWCYCFRKIPRFLVTSLPCTFPLSMINITKIIQSSCLSNLWKKKISITVQYSSSNQKLCLEYILNILYVKIPSFCFFHHHSLLNIKNSFHSFWTDCLFKVNNSLYSLQ